MSAKDELSPEELAEFKGAFDMIDVNGDGSIDAKELKGLMLEFGVDLTDAQLEVVIKMFDTDGDGKLSFDEFLAMTIAERAKTSGKDQMMTVFKHWDKNGDGKISIEELKQGLAKAGQKFSEKEIADIIATADKNGDGQLDYKEFVDLLTKD